MDDRRLTWIFGSSRSGSTCLLKKLSDFASVVPIDDPHLGHHLGVWRPIPLAWAAAEGDPPDLKTLLELKADEPGYFFSDRHRDSWWDPLRELISARFDAQAADCEVDPAAATVVVKEPGSHVAPMLVELFPASRLIFLLRDGRDVVDSWLAAHRKGAWAISGGAFPVSEEGRIPLIRWLATVWAYRSRAVQAAFDATAPERRMLIRYEELLGQTSESLRGIAEKAGLDPRPAARVAARHRFERVPVGKRGPRRRERSARPGAWKENLSSAEQAALHEEIGDALVEFGYEVSPARVIAA
jgi:hypothetical protein